MRPIVKIIFVYSLMLLMILSIPMQILAGSGLDSRSENAAVITVGGSVIDELSGASDVNCYQFSLPQTGTIEFDFEAENEYDPQAAWKVRLMDQNEQTLLEKVVKGSSAGAIFVSPKIGLAVGTYYVEVRKAMTGNYSSKKYEISVDFTQSNCWEKERNDAFDCPTAIEFGVEYHGLLSLHSDKDIFSILTGNDLEGTLVFQPVSSAEPIVGWKLKLFDESKTNVIYSDEANGRIELSLSDFFRVNKRYYLEISSCDSLNYDVFEYTVGIVTAHICDFKDISAQAPTCVTSGNIAYRICEECNKICNAEGEEISSVVIAATGHNTENAIPEVVTPATCTEAGLQMIRCTVNECGAELFSEIPELGHRVSEDWSVDEAPTCTDPGRKSHHCLNTGCTYIEDGSVVPETGHDYQTTVAKPATCITGGVIVKRCRTCGHYEEEVIAATGQHLFGEWTVTKASTCTVKGKKTQTCNGCGIMNELELDLIPHSYSADWTVDTQPTCTNAGSRSRHCVVCDHKKDEEGIAALGHDFGMEYVIDVPADCEDVGSKSRHCARCDDKADVTEIPSMGHEFSAWTVTAPATCMNKGTEGRTCSVCGKTELRETTAALGHDFRSEYVIDIPAGCETTGRQSKHCNRCGAVGHSMELPALGHSFGAWSVISAATCEETEKRGSTCTICKKTETQEIGTALGHDYEMSFTVDLAAGCETVGSKSKHCSRCASRREITEIPATGHSFGQWRVETHPTCENAGSDARICGNCQMTEHRSTGSALGHDYGATFTVDMMETCDTEGSRSRHCSRCDAKTEISKIAPTGHSYDDGTVTVSPTAETTGTTLFTCIKCGKNYTVPMEKLPPVMLDAEQEIVWNPSDKEPMCFRSAASLADFVEVRIDGQVVPRSCYTLREGSTVVELTSQYLNTLETGDYTIEIVSTTGIATARFAVEKSNAMLWIWISVGIFSAIALVMCLDVALSLEKKKRSTSRGRVIRKTVAVKSVPIQPMPLPAAKKPSQLSAPPKVAQLPAKTLTNMQEPHR